MWDNQFDRLRGRYDCRRGVRIPIHTSREELHRLHPRQLRPRSLVWDRWMGNGKCNRVGIVRLTLSEHHNADP